MASEAAVPPEVQETADGVLDALRDELPRRLSRRSVTERVGTDPLRISARLLAALDDRDNPMVAQIGAFYDTAGVVRLTHTSRQAIGERRARRTILAAQTMDGQWAYPAFQFDGATVRSDVRSILHMFRDAPVSGWTLGTWFTTPAEGLLGETPERWLARGGPHDDVIRLAGRAARRWSA